MDDDGGKWANAVEEEERRGGGGQERIGILDVIGIDYGRGMNGRRKAEQNERS